MIAGYAIYSLFAASVSATHTGGPFFVVAALAGGLLRSSVAERAAGARGYGGGHDRARRGRRGGRLAVSARFAARRQLWLAHPLTERAADGHRARGRQHGSPPRSVHRRGGYGANGRCDGNADSGDRRRVRRIDDLGVLGASWAPRHMRRERPERLATIRAGTVPFYEPDLQELVTDGMERGVLGVTDAFGDAVGPAEVVFIAVGTPSLRTGEPDLSAIDAVTDALRRMPGSDRVVGIKSTIPVGTTDRIADALRGRGPARVAHTPEFLAEGSAVSDFFHPYRVIIGTRSQTAGRVLSSLYQPLGCPILVTDPCTSEMTKYASNAFLATKVSFINQVAALCERAGADVLTVANGMGLDPRIGANFFKPGVGFGGSCLPKDTRALIALARQFKCPRLYSTRCWRPTRHSAARLWRKCASPSAISPAREWPCSGWRSRAAPATSGSLPPSTSWGVLWPKVRWCARSILRREDAAARVVPGLVCCPDPYEAAEGADAIAILTDWPEFSTLDWGRLRRIGAEPPGDGRTEPCRSENWQSRRDLFTWARQPGAADFATRRDGPRVAVPLSDPVVDRETMARHGDRASHRGGGLARPADRLRELWAYREVVWAFAERNTRLKYKQAALGVAWAVLQPLIFMAVFYVVFGRIAKISGGGASYPAFALAALVPWFFVQNSVSFGAQALLTDGALVRKLYFPREAPVLGAVLSSGLDFAFGFVLLLLLEPWLGGRCPGACLPSSHCG